MGNYELIKTSRKPFISSVEMSIIPIEGTENTYALIPPAGGLFTTPIKIIDDKTSYFVTKYDYNDEEDPNFVNEYQALVSDDILFTANEVFDNFDYEVDKDWVLEIIENSSLEVDEFLVALNEIIATFPTIPTGTLDRKDTTPEELLAVISKLKKDFRLEEILENLITFRFHDFDELILSNNKDIIFRQIIGYEDS